MITGGPKKIEQNNYVGTVSTILRILNSKDGECLSYMDKKVENIINNRTLKGTLNDSLTIQAKKEKKFRSNSIGTSYWIL